MRALMKKSTRDRISINTSLVDSDLLLLSGKVSSMRRSPALKEGQQHFLGLETSGTGYFEEVVVQSLLT